MNSINLKVVHDLGFTRITFFLRNPGYFRNIEWVVNSLLNNYSCDVRIIIGGVSQKKTLKSKLHGKRSKEKKRDRERSEAIHELQTRYPEVLFSIDYPDIRLGPIAEIKKLLIDNLFFLQEKTIGNYPARERLGIKLTKLQANLLSRLDFDSIKNIMVNGEFSLVKSMSRSKAKRDLLSVIRNLDTDLICVIPCVGDSSGVLIGLGAQTVKIPCIGLVASWDNLSIKGKFIDVFSKTLCWSNFQLTELAELHCYEKSVDKFKAVGAYPFAHRFGILGDSVVNSVPRIGSRQVTWYLSSGFISTKISSEDGATNELELINEFLFFLRDIPKSKLNQINLTFRLHPQNAKDSDFINLINRMKNDSNINFAIDASGEPIGELKRKTYDKILLSTDVAVGLATTAVLEAAFLGKPTVAPPGQLSERSYHQLLHGSYLKSTHGGPVYLAENWDQFLELLLNCPKFTPSGSFLDWTLPNITSSTADEVAEEILSTKHTFLPHPQYRFTNFRNLKVWIALCWLGIGGLLHVLSRSIKKKTTFSIATKSKYLKRLLIKLYKRFRSILKSEKIRTINKARRLIYKKSRYCFKKIYSKLKKILFRLIYPQ